LRELGLYYSKGVSGNEGSERDVWCVGPILKAFYMETNGQNILTTFKTVES